MSNRSMRSDFLKFALVLNQSKIHWLFWLMTSVLCTLLLNFRKAGSRFGSWDDLLITGYCFAGAILLFSDIKKHNGSLGNLHLLLGSLISLSFSFVAERPLTLVGYFFIAAIFMDNILATKNHLTAKIVILSTLIYLFYYLKEKSLFDFPRVLVIDGTAAHIITFIYLFATFYIIASKVSSCPADAQHRSIYFNDYCKKLTVLPCQYYHELFNLVPDIVYLTDMEGKILDANQALLNETGFSKEEIKKKSVMDFFAVEDVTPFWSARKELKKGNTVRNLEIKALVRSGQTKIYEVNVCPVRCEDSINGTINIARDVTEKKKLEAIILRQERRAAMGSLTSDFAHNFNNHLMKISGQLQILEMEPETALEMIPGILNSCDEASEVVRRLTYMAPRRQSRSQKFGLLDQIDLFLSLIPNGNRGKVIYEKADMEEHEMIGDPLFIQQILQILMDNSFEAIGTDGKIGICVRKEKFDSGEVICQYCLNALEGEWIILEISDNGKGFDPHHQERIFDPFYSTKNVTSGVGLGLFQLAGILNKMDGHIQFESRRRDGTKALVYFPVSEVK